MTGPAQISFIMSGDVTVAQLPESSMDPLDLVKLREHWLEYAEENEPRKMVVDFNHVLRFSSEAVGILIRVTQRIRSTGGDVKLCSMADRTKEVFTICKLIPGMFELFNSAGEATESFID